MAKAKMAGSGWHGQTTRHSNARRTGRAGGTYSTYSVKEGNFQSNLIKARSEQEAKNKYTAKYGYFGGMRYAKKLKDSDGDGVPDKYDCQPHNPDAQGTNEQVAEAFKMGRTDSSGTLFSEGNVIYSYGKHFPVAVKMPDGTILFNKDKYSSSTSKHQFIVKKYLDESKIKYGTTEELKKALGNALDKDLDGHKFNNSKEYIRTSGWRGYEKPTYAVAGVNDTGEYSDSPSKGSESVPELKSVQAELKKEGITSKITTLGTSNVFSNNHFLIVKPKDMTRAREVVKNFRYQHNTKYVYEE